MNAIKITLSAASMGPNATEADFDAWATYVAEHIEHVVDSTESVRVDVDQTAFSGPNAEPEDLVDGATDEQRETIRRYLSTDRWEVFCSETSAA